VVNDYFSAYVLRLLRAYFTYKMNGLRFLVIIHQLIVKDYNQEQNYVPYYLLISFGNFG